MSLIQAVNLNTATRALIKLTLSSNGRGNRPIRNALGFREIGYDITVPKFTSVLVSNLYKELDRLAKEKLPVHDIDELYQAWDDECITHHVRILAACFGPMIWGEAMDRRDPVQNPQSQLLVENENEGYTDDLFWSFSHHQRFIELQLEHLAFVKGKAYYLNHYQGKSGEARQSRHVQAEFDAGMKASDKPRRVLILVLKLSSDKLRHVQDRGTKRKHVNEEETYMPRRSRRVIDLSDKDSASIPTDLSAMTENVSASPPQKKRITTASRIHIPEKNINEMRVQLRLLLLEDLCIHQNSHNKSKNVNEMWIKSRELDDVFSVIWKADQEKIQENMGVTVNNDINEAVQDWLKWRVIASKLGEVAEMHTSEEKSLPLYTFEDWSSKLGGEPAYIETTWQLNQHVAKVQVEGIEAMSEKTTTAFAAATNWPKAVQVFKKGVISFHEKLISWREDFDR